MVIAGNITPVDVISHIPVLCEENDIPYVYVPSKEELGVAGSTKRPTSCILVQCKDKNAEHKESYDEVQKEVKKIQIAVE
jgi:H/ACA ribonucleoprotein complex subunit 2